MTVFTEGNLEITFNNVVSASKFEDHGLTCMKAVDFLVELPDRFLFIEFKDPQSPQAKNPSSEYESKFKSGKLDQNLKYKYRDSFLYEWAEGRATKTGKSGSSTPYCWRFGDSRPPMNYGGRI